MPVLPHALDVAVETPGGGNHAAGMPLEGPLILLVTAAAAGYGAVGCQQAFDAMIEPDLQSFASRVPFQLADQAQRQFAPGTPDDMKSRY